MKISNVFFLLSCLILTSQAFAQVKNAKLAIEGKDEKTSFDKFSERLSVSYFGVLTTPPLEDWDSNNAAISPEFSPGNDPCKNCDTYSMNLWSQVNIGYNFGAKFKFNVIPRWTTFLDTPSDQAKGENTLFLIEDALIAFSGVFFSSADKKFTWWMRPGTRLSTSRFARNYDSGTWGTLTHQFEWLHSITYDFSKEFQIGLLAQQRLWIYDDRYNLSRMRYFTSPFVSYQINDTTKVQAYYENMIENNRRWKSLNNKEPVYRDVWQNFYVGVAKDITPKLNIFPYISAFVNDVPFSTRSLWAGAWISYAIK
jgi:hypothetical protein